MVKWLDPTLLTCDSIGICFSEADFQRAVKRLKVPAVQWTSWLMQDALATTHHLTGDKGVRVSIVCIPVREDADGVEVATLLVHEAAHVLQEYLEYIGESQVGRETQAYALQNISARLMYAYRDELYRKHKVKEKEWTTSTTSKPTPTPSPLPPSTLTGTTLPCLNALPEGTTLLSCSTSSTNDEERKTDS